MERILQNKNSSKSQPHQRLHGTQALNHRQTKHLIKILVPQSPPETGTKNANESGWWFFDSV